MNKTGIIYGVNGPVIYLKGDPGFKISEMVYVGSHRTQKGHDHRSGF